MEESTLTAIPGGWRRATPGPEAAVFGRFCETADITSPSHPAASIRTLGKGRIGATYFNAGAAYGKSPNETLRRFLDDMARRMFPEPMVRVEGPGSVDVSVARKGGKLLVNLVNTSGPHRTEAVIESIPPVGELRVTIRQPARPASVRLEPSGQAPAFEYRDGKVTVTVPGVAIHEAIVLS